MDGKTSWNTGNIIQNEDLNIKEISKSYVWPRLNSGEKKELERTPRHKLNLPNTKRFPLLPIVGCYNIFKSSFQESWTQSSNWSKCSQYNRSERLKALLSAPNRPRSRSSFKSHFEREKHNSDYITQVSAVCLNKPFNLMLFLLESND